MRMHTLAFVSRESQAEQTRWISALQAPLPDCQILRFEDLTAAQRSDVSVAIVANPDPKDLATLPNLKWVHSLWAGVERMLAEMPGATFDIVRLVDPSMAAVMAEAVLAWTLYLHRDMPRYARQQKDRIWQAHGLSLAARRSVALLGLGALGAQAAQVLRQQNFTVMGWSRSLKTVPGIETFAGAEGLTAILAKADIVVILMPLTAETRHMINAERLSDLKSGAQIINFARGPIVEDTALLAALDSGHVSHAVLDVFATEPLPADHPYWGHPAVTVLPHISGPTDPESAVEIVSGNIKAYFTTGQMPDVVDRARGY